MVLGAGVAQAQPALVTVGTRGLTMRDGVPTSQRAFSWAVRSKLDDPAHQTSTPVPGSASDPTTAGATGGGAVLTVYNPAGTGESFTVTLPADRWRLQGNPSNGLRFVYANDPALEPVWKVWLKGAKLTVRGGKQHWGYTLDEPTQGRIAIRLTLGTGVTYCTDVPAGSYDAPNRFRGLAFAPAPSSCPPTP